VEWFAGLNRLVVPSDLPITLQGGEPTLHPEFSTIVNGIRPDLNVDLLTNLETDLDRFIAEIPPGRMRRDAPYASIRVSYHPETMRIESLAAKVLFLQKSGYSIGIWGVLHPDWISDIKFAQDYCLPLGIDFRTKEFLGEHAGAMHGEFSYPDACDRKLNNIVSCRTTELIIGPDGGIYRCHSDLYAGRPPVGNILDPELVMTGDFRRCDCYGFCNPCDVKLKTNRFQSFGHTSVEILFDECRNA
jgi:MoaA/NifB/PqqE/SkfB family radical SAM enzyme